MANAPGAGRDRGSSSCTASSAGAPTVATATRGNASLAERHWRKHRPKMTAYLEQRGDSATDAERHGGRGSEVARDPVETASRSEGGGRDRDARTDPAAG